MASPLAVTSATQVTTQVNRTSPVIPIPTGTTTGDLIICSLFGIADSTITNHQGFALLDEDDSGLGPAPVTLLTKTSDGTEGSSVTLTADGTSNSEIVAVTYKTRRWTDVESSIVQGGASATPDPPNLAPSLGLADYLWIAFAHFGLYSATAYPSGYSSTVTVAGTTMTQASAHRFATASSENPGQFTLDSALGTWRATTIGVRGVMGGGWGTVTI